MFSKEALDKVFQHLKYNHKIELVNEGKNYSQPAFCGMSKPQLEFVKRFLKKNFKKDFIEASKVFCLSPILLAKKPSEDIQFCIDYGRLNELTKKNVYQYQY